MRSRSVDQQDLKNEHIQIFVRIILATIIMIHLSYINFRSTWDHTYSYIQLMSILSIIFISNVLYKFFIAKYPFFLQKQRIIITSIFDVTVTSYALYLGHDIAAFYPGVLLWFIIGYSMRYGYKVGFVVYFSVIFSWTFLISISSFWETHYSIAIGWLIAYIVIPLYFFKMLDRLHDTIAQLHQDVDNSMYKAGHDPLTKLPNRFLFEETLEEYADHFKNNHKKFALFFIDLDGFKQINDLFGHHKGDDTLIETANKILSVNPQTFRLGGDEFVSIVEYKEEEELALRAKSLIDGLRKYYHQYDIYLSASIGIARCMDEVTSPYDLKKHADIAMYQAKLKGKDNYCFYEEIY